MATILIVDDDEDFADLLCMALLEDGFATIGLDDESQVLSVVTSQPDVGLIITDGRAMSMSGIALCVKLKEEGYNIPMILLSACVDGNINELLRLGFAAVMEKPVGLDELSQTVKRVLENAAMSKLLEG